MQGGAQSGGAARAAAPGTGLQAGRPGASAGDAARLGPGLQPADMCGSVGPGPTRDASGAPSGQLATAGPSGRRAAPEPSSAAAPLTGAPDPNPVHDSTGPHLRAAVPRRQAATIGASRPVARPAQVHRANGLEVLPSAPSPASRAADTGAISAGHGGSGGAPAVLASSAVPALLRSMPNGTAAESGFLASSAPLRAGDQGLADSACADESAEVPQTRRVEAPHVGQGGPELPDLASGCSVATSGEYVTFSFDDV